MKSVLAIGCFLLCSAAQAALINFDFSSHTGDLGPDETYTVSTFSVIAMGFPATAGDHLFGKNAGLNETGLGLMGDPTTENEIWRTADTRAFVQLDLQNIINQLGNNVTYTFTMNSTSGGESWNVYAGTTTGTLPAGVSLSGTDQLSHVITPGTRFLDFAATNVGDNVLLATLSFNTPSVPEPSSVVLMGAGIGLLALMMRRRILSARS